jgi:hypothetical protein
MLLLRGLLCSGAHTGRVVLKAVRRAAGTALIYHLNNNRGQLLARESMN